MRSRPCSFALGCLLLGLVSPAPAAPAGDNADVSSFETIHASPEMVTPSRSQTRAPALIYYAVDSAEPFMQLAIDYEIRQLRAACEAHATTNWIIILNSAVVAHRAFEVCRAGRFEERVVDYSSIDLALSYASDPDFQLELHPLALRFPPEASDAFKHFNRYYATYPLTNADVLFNLMATVATDVFPAAAYELFLQVKAHGSPLLAATAPDAEALTQKQVHQRHSWQNLVAAGVTSETLVELTPGSAGVGREPPMARALLDRIGLGAITALQDDAASNPERLPLVHGLGRYFLGIDARSDRNYFGISGETLAKVSRALSDELMLDAAFAFLFFETCDSRIQAESTLALNEALRFSSRLAAYYSAAGSLWFRNLDWDVLFEDLSARPTAAHLQDLLMVATARVPNFIVRISPPLSP